DASLRVAEREAARARVERGIRHETRAARERANLPFEVLYLVEVLAPVQTTLSRSGAAQVDRVAESLAHSGQVPHAAVLAAIVVAGSAAHVAVAREARVARVVEQLLTREHRGR